MSGFVVRDLGTLQYQSAVELQRQILEGILDGSQPETLLLLEHPEVITLGAGFHEENLLHPRTWYSERQIQVLPTDRGGDVTYHAPGQLVAYPLFSLESRGKDLHRWLRDLEQVVISVVAAFGLEGCRFPPHTGVWIGNRKVCAMGIKVRRWISMHGLALNCDNSLEPFSEIVPCGIADYGVTSLSQEAGRRIDVEAVKPMLVEAFRSQFNLY